MTTRAGSVDLSIVVPTTGRAASVDRLLASLAVPGKVPPFEVVVSIDGESDATRHVVERHAKRLAVRCLCQPRRGRAAACNAGARSATGRLLLLLDDDMEASARLLPEHLHAHEAGAARAVVGAAPVPTDAASRPLVRYRAAVFARKLRRLSDSPEPRALDMYTGNFSVPRALFLAQGGFDEGFVGYGNEDFELLLRLTRAGTRLGFSPSAVAWQHYEKGYPELAHDTRSEGRNAVLLAERHPEVVDELYFMQLERDRGLRRALLSLSARLGGARPGWLSLVDTLVHAAERRRSERLFAWYDFAFDLHYSIGVRSALRERGGGRPLTMSAWLESLRDPPPRRAPAGAG